MDQDTVIDQFVAHLSKERKDDIALMNEDIMPDSFKGSTKVYNIIYLNQVWFADTSIDSDIVFSRLWKNICKDSSCFHAAHIHNVPFPYAIRSSYLW